MKNKKLVIIISILSVIIVGLLGWFLYSKLYKKDNINDFPPLEQKELSPLMYEITKEGSNNKIYLFGSIHMINPSDLNFPEYVRKAYNDSQYLACEMDSVAYTSDTNKMTEMVQQMLYQDGTTIKNHINNDTYNKLVKILKEKEMYSELLEMYKPVFFQSYLLNAVASDAKINSTSSVDEYFIKKAKTDNKNILEVEGGDFQMNLLLNTSDRLNELMLIEILDNYEDEVKSLRELYEAWRIGDVEKILVNSDEDIKKSDNYSKEDQALIDEYNYKMFDERNLNMTNTLIDYFNSNKKTFYMVGAAHLVGDKGIAHLLEEKGYIVKRVQS